MRIGFSFFWQVISGWGDPNKFETWQLAVPDVEQTLSHFKAIGIESIELKLTEQLELSRLFAVIEKLRASGFYITFHAPARFQFPQDLTQQINSFLAVTKFMNDQFQLIPLWVIHPLSSRCLARSVIYNQTVAYLDQLLAALTDCSAQFAIEILRNRTGGEKVHVGDSYEDILDILSHLEHDRLGICWDFGHANAMYNRGLQDQFPPPEFLRQVIHCHVHDCNNEKTHLPLGMGDVAVRQNIELLQQHGFEGILNLELVPHRIDEPRELLNYVEQSVGMIRNWLDK